MEGVQDQMWEHVAGEGKRELGRAGREKQKANVRNRKSLQKGKGLSCDCRQGRAGRSCEVGETGTPRTPVWGPLI